MKSIKLICSAGLTLLLGVSAITLTHAQTNLALDAKVSTSYVSSWENLSAVNDNYQPSNSGDKGPGAYGNWQGAAAYNQWDWVEYTFGRKNHIDSVRVFWWTDNGGIQIPYEAYVQYFVKDSLQTVGNIGIKANQYNSLAVGVDAFKVRVNMRSTAATGILEFQVFGSLGEEMGMNTYAQVNGGEKVVANQILVSVGDQITITNEMVNLSASEGTWSWTGPKGFTSTDSMVVISDIQKTQFGKYSVTYTSNIGIDYVSSFYIFSGEVTADKYEWESYPQLVYDFRQDYPDFAPPTKDLDDVKNVAGTMHSKWWIFKWGPNRRSNVTDTAITLMLERFDKDFSYFRDSMNWPPDKRAKEGYYSGIYLYGSGLSTDNVDTTAVGGWQGATTYKGESWPMVLASYYPVAAYDPTFTMPNSDDEYQMGAMVHEGIHAILADMPGANAPWFNEAGNTWLQQEMTARQSGSYTGMGFLNACPVIAPFMPIECYSGWLQDNSFGGPAAERVNMFSETTQICTWRRLLGGNQYANTFPVFMGQVLGVASVAWVCQYARNNILDGIALGCKEENVEGIGDENMRRFIMEYAAKKATVDWKQWSGAIRSLLDNNMNASIGSEWTPTWLKSDVWYATPYARTSMADDGTLTPEYRTTPGWSGSNQIPLKVKGDSIAVKFTPIGENMTCQIAYRDILGEAVYSHPVYTGTCALKLQVPAANDVVFVVVTNTDYIYESEETGKKHFDYRIQIDTTQATLASTTQRWYAWNENIENVDAITLPAISSPDTLAPLDIFLNLNTILETDKAGTVAGVLSTEDPNDVTVQTYALVSGDGSTDNSSFKISGSNLVNKKLLDYETKAVYTVRVRSTNLTGKYVEKSFEIPVTDVIETSFENLADSKNISVYPNPIDHTAKVKLTNGETIGKIEVINLTGAVVKTIGEINSNEYLLNNNANLKGVYYLKVYASSNYVVKVIFQ